jgi:hypothetical protein
MSRGFFKFRLAITHVTAFVALVPDLTDDVLYPCYSTKALPALSVFGPADGPARGDLVEAGVNVVGVEDGQVEGGGQRQQRKNGGEYGGELQHE